VTKRQVVVLGRHSILPSGWVICLWSRPWGRGGSRIGGHSQGGKVRWHCWTSHVWTNSRWNPGRFQCVSHSASEWTWQEDLLTFWWHQRNYSFVSASFGAGTAFQCCSATRQPAGPWLRGLSIIPFQSFSSIFKTTLGNRYRGYKIILIMLCITVAVLLSGTRASQVSSNPQRTLQLLLSAVLQCDDKRHDRSVSAQT